MPGNHLVSVDELVLTHDLLAHVFGLLFLQEGVQELVARALVKLEYVRCHQVVHPMLRQIVHQLPVLVAERYVLHRSFWVALHVRPLLLEQHLFVHFWRLLLKLPDGLHLLLRQVLARLELQHLALQLSGSLAHKVVFFVLHDLV